jgi:hypothetical protein
VAGLTCSFASWDIRTWFQAIGFVDRHNPSALVAAFFAIRTWHEGTFESSVTISWARMAGPELNDSDDALSSVFL